MVENKSLIGLIVVGIIAGVIIVSIFNPAISGMVVRSINANSCNADASCEMKNANIEKSIKFRNWEINRDGTFSKGIVVNGMVSAEDLDTPGSLYVGRTGQVEFENLAAPIGSEEADDSLVAYVCVSHMGILFRSQTPCR